jgi:thiamine pyrophosphate-dependent acetolactate synthase large subunit-like protein
LYAADIPVVIQRAFKMARQLPTGPVLVSLPQDVLNQSLDFKYMPGTPLLTRLHADADAINSATELLGKAQESCCPLRINPTYLGYTHLGSTRWWFYGKR